MAENMTATEVRNHFERAGKDLRWRAIAMSCVAAAMDEHGPIDPERAQRAAHDIAGLATSILISRIFMDDAELRALKEENERLKKLALDTVSAYPPRLIVPALETTSPTKPTIPEERG